MPNASWVNAIDPFPATRGAAKASFTAYQDISPLQLPMIQPNELRLGTKLELEAWGEFSTTGTPTLQIGFVYGATAGAAGGTSVGASGTITAGTATAWPWHIRYGGIITTVGTSGVLYGSGILDLGTSLIAFASSGCPVTAAGRSVTVDTTVSKLIGVGAAWGASSASNTITVDVFTCKISNQGKTS